MSPTRSRKVPRGTSLIEAMVASTVLLFGLMGFAGLQLTTVKTNHFARRLTQASALAMDLQESMTLWSYSDGRLATGRTVSSLADSAVTGRWDMGRNTTAAFVADYSDKVSDTNATNPGALGVYPGLPADADADGRAEFVRYWSVTQVDLTGSGTPNGKLVQVIVRWQEPGIGWRQVTGSTFKPNPAFAIR